MEAEKKLSSYENITLLSSTQQSRETEVEQNRGISTTSDQLPQGSSRLYISICSLITSGAGISRGIWAITAVSLGSANPPPQWTMASNFRFCNSLYLVCEKANSSLKRYCHWLVHYRNPSIFIYAVSNTPLKILKSKKDI